MRMLHCLPQARSIQHSGHGAEPRQFAVSRMTGGTSTQIPRRSQTIGLKTFPVSLVKELITTDTEAEESNSAHWTPSVAGTHLSRIRAGRCEESSLSLVETAGDQGRKAERRWRG